MKLITRQSLASGAAEKWLHQYPEDKDGVAKKISALGDNPNPDDVDKIIGNCSWTHLGECNDCGESVTGVKIQLGEKLDYDSCTACVCARCLRFAMRMVEDMEGTE